MEQTAEELLQFADRVSDLVWLLDSSAIIRFANAAHAAELEIDPAQLVGCEASLQVHETDRALFEAVALSRNGGEAAVRVRTGLGTWARVAWSFHRPDNGSSDVLCVGRVEAQEQRGQTALFATLARNIPGTVYLCRNDATYSMMYLNDEVRRLTGLSRESFIAGDVSFVDLYHPDDAEGIPPQVDEALDRRAPFHLVYRLRHASGEYRWVEEHGQGIWNADGELAMLEGAIFDITERRHAEEEKLRLQHELMESQRLESLGLLAGGVAHDFNNLLASIVGNTELVQAEHGSSPEADAVLSAARKAATLTGQLLAYAGQGVTERKPIELSGFISEMRELLETTVTSRYVSRFDSDVDEVWVMASPGELQQLVMNLLMNAREAMGDTGEIRITTSRRSCGERSVWVRPRGYLPTGTYAVLEVGDDGVGMDAEVQSQIFEPFFSTKERGHGLGLCAVLGTVQTSHGGLEVESVPGEGSTFRVWLPVTDERPTVRPEVSSPTGSRRLLVVDDDDQVRTVTTKLLERSGMSCVACADGRSAVDALAGAPEECDLAVLDMTMPGLSGVDTMIALREIRPDLPILFISGHDADATLERVRGHQRIGFIQKPYAIRDLVRRINELLGDGDGSAAR